MIRRLVVVSAGCLMLGLASLHADERQARVLMQAADAKATVQGDLRAAIAMYEQAAKEAGANRALTAQALLRMAACYDKLNDSTSRAVYERLVREFADQPDIAGAARAHLAAAGDSITLRTLPRSSVLPGNITPDGRYFAYYNWDDGGVYVRDLQSGIDRLLIKHSGFNGGIPAISSDGKHVAYQVFSSGCGVTRGEGAALCMIDIMGDKVSAPRVLVSGKEVLEVAPLEWSPNGRTMAITIRRQDRSAQVALLDVASGAVRTIKTSDWRGPTRGFFSPDGRSLVFDIPAGDTTDDRTILLVDLASVRGMPIVEHGSQNIPMGWVPDGSGVLFASDRNGAMSLWLQPIDRGMPNSPPKLLRTNIGGAWSLGVSRTGALAFAVSTYDRDIAVASVDLESGKQVGDATRPIRRYVGTNSYGSWSPDGRLLAYVSQPGFDPTSNTGRLIGIHDMISGEERELRPQLLYFARPEWSPDGRTLLLAGTDTKGRDGVFTVDVQTAAVRLVVETPRGTVASWSDDGRRVVYLRWTDNAYSDGSIVERTVATGAERVIVPSRERPRYFSVSPDGRLMVFRSERDGSDGGGALSALTLLDLVSGDIRELLRPVPPNRVAQAITPEWTADSTALLARMIVPNQLWLVPVGGGAPRPMDIDVRGWSLGGIGQIALDRAHSRIAFLTGQLSMEVVVLEHFLPRK